MAYKIPFSSSKLWKAAKRQLNILAVYLMPASVPEQKWPWKYGSPLQDTICSQISVSTLHYLSRSLILLRCFCILYSSPKYLQLSAITEYKILRIVMCPEISNFLNSTGRLGKRVLSNPRFFLLHCTAQPEDNVIDRQMIDR